MSNKVDSVDIVVGLCWGDESKGKVVSQLSKNGDYNLVARWAGGNNAGHTIYVDGNKYKTHLIPSGVFYGIPSLIGPGCVLHPSSFQAEIDYLEENGFNSKLVKVHPNCHIVQEEHIQLDKDNLAKKLGTTSKGIAYAYADKAARKGVLAKQILEEKWLWKSELSGKILCEGAQGVWLDLDHGNYPYVTSSTTLPYGACSLGFAPQKINKIYGCAKVYDTRSGQDPLFPDSLLDDPLLTKVGELGEEYGVTTGRRRKVNWLNLNALINSINLTGTTHLVISKCDILFELGIFPVFKDEKLIHFKGLKQMQTEIVRVIKHDCPLIQDIIFSSSPETI